MRDSISGCQWERQPISGCGSVWQSTCFGSRGPQVQILSSRPKVLFNFSGVDMKCPVCRESKTSFEYIKKGILNKGLLIGLESVKESAFKLSRHRECKCLSCGFTFKY